MQVITHLNRQQQLDILSKAPFFSRFSGDERNILLLHGPELLAYVEGEYVVKEGDDQDHSLYVILNGELSIYRGKEEVAKIGRGHCFGEVSFLSATPRTASVKCNTNAAIFQLKREHMNRLPVTAREKIKDNLIAMLLNRLNQGPDTGPAATAPDGSDPWP